MKTGNKRAASPVGLSPTTPCYDIQPLIIGKSFKSIVALFLAIEPSLHVFGIMVNCSKLDRQEALPSIALCTHTFLGIKG